MPDLKSREPLLGYIVLASLGGGCLLVYLPGEGIKIIPPEDPEWGHRIKELARVFESVGAIAEAGNRFPQIRKQCHAIAEELIASHEDAFRALAQR